MDVIFYDHYFHSKGIKKVEKRKQMLFHMQLMMKLKALKWILKISFLLRITTLIIFILSIRMRISIFLNNQKSLKVILILQLQEKWPKCPSWSKNLKSSGRTRKTPSWHNDYVVNCNTSKIYSSSEINSKKLTSSQYPPTYPYFHFALLTETHKSFLTTISQIK